jgi:glycerol uptake facilitator-like aquaporin
MDLRRLRAGEWIAALSGALLLASLFVHWYHRGPVACIALAGVKCPSPEGFSAWEAFSVIDVALALVALFALALWVITASQPTAAIAIAMDALVTLLGIVATIVVIVRLANLPDLGPHVGRTTGIYLALAGALGIVIGGWLGMQDERVPAKRPTPERVPPPEPAR